jgi:hypothetical protein
MSVFVVRHQHAPRSMPATDFTADARVLNHRYHRCSARWFVQAIRSPSRRATSPIPAVPISVE